MADNNDHPSDPPSAPEFHSKQPTQPEATLQDVLDTMHDSDFFPRSGKDAPSRFWSAYERVAKQHDDEFIERHNGEMDVLLIFVRAALFASTWDSIESVIQAGLFSAVSSAFIVNMQSSLTPSASDTTNALLKILVNKIDNTTFPPQEAALPVWTGPSSSTIWIQTLAYTSLSSSLLAAFGAVLGKQWLGHFKTSRFGRGALHERCERRQKKLDGLESWHFSMILATLPVFLQLSLLFFGIALAGNIWALQHTVASVIMATTAFGLIFYIFTTVSSLKSPDCPFQTPISIVLLLALRGTSTFRKEFRQKWEERPKTWGGFLDRLRESSRRAGGGITQLLMHFISYHSRFLSALRHKFRPAVNDPEAAGVVGHSISEAAGEHTEPSIELDLRKLLELPIEIAHSHAIQAHAVRWIIETSTDIDNIAAAAGIVPEIEWMATEGVTEMSDRLKNHFYACFDPAGYILPLAQARAVACLKAMHHCSVVQNRGNQFLGSSQGNMFFKGEYDSFTMAPDQSYRVVHCAVEYPAELDIKSLPLSDRLWMAHMFTYRLHRGDKNPEFVAFLIDFIDDCLDTKSPARLVADCVLLAGMLLGLQVDGQHFVRLDKSKAIDVLIISVLDLTLGVLVGDIPGRRDTALTLFHPLLQQFVSYDNISDRRSLLDRAIRFCFHLLNENPDTTGEDQFRSRNLAHLIHIIIYHPFWNTKDFFTAAQFDLLVEYHFQICEGTDYDLVQDSFYMLEHCSSNSPEPLRRYIDTIIRFMREETTCVAALHAALAIQLKITSMAHHDESIREDFSKALALAALLFSIQTTLADNPFLEISSFYWARDKPYLKLVCALSQDPTWHHQLHQDGHFENCLAIAKTLLSHNGALFKAHNYAASVAHIFATIDASGDETHPLFNTVWAYPRRPLVLQAWKYIFDNVFFQRPGESFWIMLSRDGYLDSLPSLVVYAKKQLNNNDEPLIALVEQICRKLDEEKQQCGQKDAQHVHDRSLWYEEISALGKQIHALLEVTFLTDV